MADVSLLSPALRELAVLREVVDDFGEISESRRNDVVESIEELMLALIVARFDQVVDPGP